MLDINGASIPTVDEDGHVTWGKISAVTRHDPGTELYEIITKGGRQVIVTVAKSLLVWKHNKFIMASIAEVNVGDFVPVTMSLPKYNNNNDPINASEEVVCALLKCFVEEYGKVTDIIEIFADNNTLLNYLNMLCNRIGIFCELKVGNAVCK